MRHYTSAASIYNRYVIGQADQIPFAVLDVQSTPRSSVETSSFLPSRWLLDSWNWLHYTIIIKKKSSDRIPRSFILLYPLQVKMFNRVRRSPPIRIYSGSGFVWVTSWQVFLWTCVFLDTYIFVFAQIYVCVSVYIWTWLYSWLYSWIK